MTARMDGSWDEYYSFFAGRLSQARFHISMKESEETFELLEELDYIENDLAEEIFEINIGEWGYHVHEEFDDEYNLISSENSVEIFHAMPYDPPEYRGDWFPDYEFVERWFQIPKRMILGFGAGLLGWEEEIK